MFVVVEQSLPTRTFTNCILASNVASGEFDSVTAVEWLTFHFRSIVYIWRIGRDCIIPCIDEVRASWRFTQYCLTYSPYFLTLFAS